MGTGAPGGRVADVTVKTSTQDPGMGAQERETEKWGMENNEWEGGM